MKNSELSSVIFYLLKLKLEGQSRCSCVALTSFRPDLHHTLFLLFQENCDKRQVEETL